MTKCIRKRARQLQNQNRLLTKHTKKTGAKGLALIKRVMILLNMYFLQKYGK